MKTLVINRVEHNLCSDGQQVSDFGRICLKIQLKKVCKKVLEHNLDVSRVKAALRHTNAVPLEYCPRVKMKTAVDQTFLVSSLIKSRFVQSFCSVLVVLIAIYGRQWHNLLSGRCTLANNYFVMEMTRPITDCKICRNVRNFVILDNPSKEEFSKYAYTGQPILVRGATDHWSALKTFNFEFFRKIYSETPDAYESVENECQFFPFRTDFRRLSEVFEMPEERVRMTGPDPKPWYIGWSNCNPEVASILRKHYKRPDFLPDDSESSAIDWIFMGYAQPIGASMHLDYVQRPSWQAQIAGSKTWHLLPPPECEPLCTPINITVNTGEIILIDTNQWYHDTHPTPGAISITIGSEYD